MATPVVLAHAADGIALAAVAVVWGVLTWRRRRR